MEPKPLVQIFTRVFGEVTVKRGMSHGRESHRKSVLIRIKLVNATISLEGSGSQTLAFELTLAFTPVTARPCFPLQAKASSFPLSPLGWQKAARWLTCPGSLYC